MTDSEESESGLQAGLGDILASLDLKYHLPNIYHTGVLLTCVGAPLWFCKVPAAICQWFAIYITSGIMC